MTQEQLIRLAQAKLHEVQRGLPRGLSIAIVIAEGEAGLGTGGLAFFGDRELLRSMLGQAADKVPTLHTQPWNVVDMERDV